MSGLSRFGIFFTKSEGEIAPIDQASIILFPVLDSISGLAHFIILMYIST